MYLAIQPFFDQLFVFVLILTRISGLVLTAPGYGAQSAPMQVRALLAVSLAFLVTPLHWATPVPDPGNLINLGVLLGRELVVGMALGLALVLLFTGLQLAGQVIGQMSGIQLADVFDPGSNTSIPVFSKLLDLVALAAFFAIGGHRQLMRALLDTFAELPPGTGAVSPDASAELVRLVTLSFDVGIRVSAPVVIALLMSVLIMGLISRTMPQLNILAVGFNMNSLVMLGVLTLSLGTIVWVVQDHVDVAIDSVLNSLLPMLPA